LEQELRATEPFPGIGFQNHQWGTSPDDLPHYEPNRTNPRGRL